jgi:hypothetical protein
MLETVIELRRKFFGFRETRSLGAYCATCKIGVPMENNQSAAHQPTSTSALSRSSAKGLLSAWWNAIVSQSSCSHAGVIHYRDFRSPAK